MAVDIGERAASIGKLLLSGGAIVIIVLIIVACLAGVGFYIKYRRKFDIDVEVVSERSGAEPVTYRDRAAILIDGATKAKYFKLWYDKADLPVPPYNILNRIGGRDRLRIWKKSENEYYFLTPPQIDKKLIVKQNGKTYRIATEKYIPVETNINYWNIKRKGQHKKLFDTESLLMKILPYIPLIVGGVFTIMILYILMNYLPPILASLKDLAIELQSLKGAEVTAYN